MTFWKWSKTAATNATADSTCPWPEGMAPSQVNDSARGNMAALAKYRDDISGAIATTGTSTAYAVASNQGFAALANLDGVMIAFTPHATNTGACTLNVDGLGAKPLRGAPGIELPSGTLILGTPYVALYNNTSGVFYLQGGVANPYSIPIGGFMPYLSTTPPNSSFVLPFGQAISRATYATLFAMIGTTFGAGDGSTTFNIPDLRGRVIAGMDINSGGFASRITTAGSGVDGTVLGATGGGQNKTLVRSDLPNVNATVAITDSGHVHTGNAGIGTQPVNIGTGNGGPNVIQTDGAAKPTTSATTGITATVNLNGGVTQTLVNGLQPSIILPMLLRVI